MADRYDLVVVGGGPGGYTAAIRAAQLGMQTAVVERDRLGGVCGNWGCIPSKAIIRSADVYDRAKRGEKLGIVAGSLSFDYAKIVAHSRGAADRVARGVKSLMKKNAITVIAGEGRLNARGQLVVGTDVVDAERILLATGSGERVLPGLEPAPPQVVTSRELLEETTLPGSVVIVGGGAIGVEFGYVFSSLGVKVTIVELEAQLLPGTDETIAKELERVFSRRGIEIRTKTGYRSIDKTSDGVVLHVEKDGQVEEIRAERCVVAVGRRARVEELGLTGAGVSTERGLITINDRFETSVPHVLAIGDLVDSPQLAHVAAAEGIAAVEIVAGRRPPGRLDPLRIPGCVYCHPEVATIGLSEAAARERGYDVKVGTFPYRALGRAVASDEMEGVVKLVTEARYGEILGCHVIGGSATDIIAEAAMTMGLEGTVWDLGGTVHAHPTFAEGVMEAALAATGEGVNA
ncbi:MAG: dihydrolipoyl dehydrogenase [Candidatus Binatia bacterium]|nr:dihydrolipoyl dehydrogenase [Candidatus Binatia bacterium]